ncbi:MAG: zinc-dependent dehydrogenase [Candidatus Omnitrophota bacterium]|nr:MAG: zinc-dependent dehydrogenase [Candidatus Omnitrophota bacterium]
MYYNNRDVRLEEVPAPKIGPGELLVKVIAGGICGTDVLEWYRLKKAPRVLGHEITGEIAEVGNGVKGYKVGDRVFVSHHVPCNTCHWCLTGHHTACETLHTTNYFPGGFAEYIRVPKINVEHGVFLLPGEISFEEGTFIEPLACVVRGQRLAEIKKGQSVLILGSGISGLLHLLLARVKGARPVITTDINEYRLKIAQKLGADAVMHAGEDIPGNLRKINDNRLADVVIVCTGAFSAFKQALQSAERGGTILFFAATSPDVELPVPVNKFWRNEMKLMTSYANSPSDAAEAIELIRSKSIPVRKMITHRLNLKDTGRGFQLVAEARKCVKVIVEPYKRF